MMILGLDLGATTGWAFMDDESSTNKFDIVWSGATKVTDRKSSAQRFVNFNNLLDNLHASATPKIKCIYYEYVYMNHKSTEAAYAYGGYKACLEVWSSRHNIRLQGVLCSSARKLILGSGGLKKEEAFDKIKKLYPSIKDHNEADAVIVARYGVMTDAEELQKTAEANKRKGKK